VESGRLKLGLYVLVSMLLAVLWHPAAWHYFRYDFVGKDTLFHLSIAGQVGLVLMTGVLIVCLLSANLWKSRFLARHGLAFAANNAFKRLTLLAVDLCLAVLFFVVSLSLIPQLQYLYYMRLFDYLPLQWVGALPDQQRIQTIVSMNPIDSLNTVISGLCFWSMICGVLIFWLYRYTRAQTVTHRWMIRLGLLGVISAGFIAAS